MIEISLALVNLFVLLLVFIGVVNMYSRVKDLQRKVRKVQKSLDDMWVFCDGNDE